MDEFLAFREQERIKAPRSASTNKPFFWVLLERQKYLGRVHQMPQKLINSLRTKPLHLNFQPSQPPALQI
ncbi:hypothetical protein [Vibrio spartinae]|uniref:Uncharacterized protein n=1 Tax=Vibrio spartinae TaxID=1918945 RepID=A0A1N6M522_9VIBR|nr:hypothetical protein [Vibrio spartinae]SIO94539.1 hypothetical protein VSP9026_02250 [Vibrio spartinae]